MLFAVPGFRAVRSCLVGPGCLVCPLRRFGPPAVCCSRVPGCAFLPRRAGLLGVPGCLMCPSRCFRPVAVCCAWLPGCAFLPRRVGLCVPASSGRAAWCAGLLVSSVVPLCTDQSCPPVTNVARNSPPHISDCDIRPLELQRLWAISKNDRVKLRAKLIWRSPRFPRGHRGLARAHRRSLHRWRWGFCSIRSLPSACRRRVAPLMMQFPPFGGGEVAT